MQSDQTNPILQFIQEASGGSSYQQALASNAQLGQQAAADAEAAMAAQNDLALIANRQQLEGDLAAQEEARKVKAQMGGDSSDPNYLIGMLTQEFQDNTRAAIAERQQIDKMDSINPLSSPLQWLVSQFTVNDVISRHNFHSQAADEAAATINQISTVTSAAAQMAKETAKVSTRESIAAKLEAQANAGLLAMAQLRQQNVMHDTNALQALQQGKIQELNAYYEAENHKMRLAEFARSGERFAWEQQAAEDLSTMRKLQLDMHMEEWNAKQDEKARILADEQKSQEIINLGAQVIGYKGDLSKTSIKQLQSNPEMKKVFDDLFWAGYNKITSGRTTISGTPGQAITTLKQANTVANWLDTPAKPTLLFLNSVVNDAQRSSTEVKMAKNAAEQQSAMEAYVNKESAARVKLWAADAERKDSLFKAPSLEELTAATPSVTDSVLHNKVLAPLVAATGSSDMSFERVIGAVRAAVDTGKLSENQAAVEVANLYSTAMAVNNNSKQFQSFGLPAQTTYNIKAGESILGIGKDFYFDVSKPEQVMKYFQYKRMQGASPVIQGMLSVPLVNSLLQYTAK